MSLLLVHRSHLLHTHRPLTHPRTHRLLNLAVSYGAPQTASLVVSQLVDHVFEHPAAVFALAAQHGHVGIAGAALVLLADDALAGLAALPSDVFGRIPSAALHSSLKVAARCRGVGAAERAQAARQCTVRAWPAFSRAPPLERC